MQNIWWQLRFFNRVELITYLRHNRDCDLASIDVSWLTSLYDVFSGRPRDDWSWIETWDVSNITDMRNLFCASDFTQWELLKNWDVSNVVNMSGMFMKCWKFNWKWLENWNTSKVTNMYHTFSSTWLSDIDLWNWGCVKSNEYEQYV